MAEKRPCNGTGETSDTGNTHITLTHMSGQRRHNPFDQRVRAIPGFVPKAGFSLTVRAAVCRS
jgi:hypothetical protein